MTKIKRAHKLSPTPEIVFSSSNFEKIVPGHGDLMVISAKMVNANVKRVFIDQGSSADIIFRNTFDKLELKNTNLQIIRRSLLVSLGRRFT